MGQQPNIELPSHEYTPGAEPGPPRPWSPSRPGELNDPADVPAGGPFGRTGPDSGYAYRLIADREREFPQGEHRADSEAVLAALAAARAAQNGRGPTAEDVDVAEVLLGYDTNLPEGVAAELAAARPGWMAGAAHDSSRTQRVVASVSGETLGSDPAALRRRLAAGERFIDL
jgi:hypothetical protein